jgi:hypothetical protein
MARKTINKEEKKPDTAEMHSVGAWAKAQEIETWQLSGMLRLKRWTADKMITSDDFSKALKSLLNHRAGKG